MQASVSSMARPGVSPAIDELDMGALGRSLWRKKRWIIGLTLAATALAMAGVNLVTPRYKSEARVLIETRENIFLRPDAERSQERGSTVDLEAVTSQVQLMLSRDLARDIVKTLKLGDRAEFDPVLRGPSLAKALLVDVGMIKDPMSQTPEERVLKSYYERLVAFPVDKSRVIALEFESEDPELAAQATNAIAEAYLAFQRSAKQDQSRSASQWLAGEIETLRQKVADAESKVEQHRSKSNLLMGTNNTTLSNQQLGEFNAQVGTARAQRIETESKARFIREALRNGNAIEFSEIVNSDLMRRLSEQRVTLRTQLAEQSSTLLDQHPRIKELRAQIADLDRQLRVEADRLARSLENDAKMVEARVQSLNASFDQMKFQAASINEQDVQLRALERDAKSQRDLLESYLAKYREAAARDNIGSVSPEARIISSAIVSNTPSFPKTLPTVLVAALGMFVLSSGFILSGELLKSASAGTAAGPIQRSTIADPILESLQAVTLVAASTPAIGPVKAQESPGPSPIPKSMPTSVSAPVPERVPDPVPSAVPLPAPTLVPLVQSEIDHRTTDRGATDHPATDHLAKDRRASGQGAAHGDHGRVETIVEMASALSAAGAAGGRIVVFGTRQNVGTTQAAISLARALAAHKKVVLVDLSLRSPNLSAIVNDPSAPGLTDAINGAATFKQIIVRDRMSPAHVVMAGSMTEDVRAIMYSPDLVIALEALGRAYDHVVVDAGTLSEVSAERLARITQVAVLVCERADDLVTGAALEQIEAGGFNSVRLVSGTPGPLPDQRVGGSREAA